MWFPIISRKKQNVKWVEKLDNKFLRFSLYNGQVGKCSTDHKKRIKGEPYTERADVKQWSKLQKKSQYEINFRFRIVEGFKSRREKFFKISSKSGNCSKTSLFLQFSGRKNPKGLRLHALDMKRSVSTSKKTFNKYKLEYKDSKIQVPKLINKRIKI